jgi:hypothetical protein
MFKRILIVLILSITVCICSCADPEKKAREIFDIAVFEEKQFNADHANELYKDIIQNYPDTSTAEAAQEALIRLNSGRENGQ